MLTVISVDCRDGGGMSVVTNHGMVHFQLGEIGGELFIRPLRSAKLHVGGFKEFGGKLQDLGAFNEIRLTTET